MPTRHGMPWSQIQRNNRESAVLYASLQYHYRFYNIEQFIKLRRYVTWLAIILITEFRSETPKGNVSTRLANPFTRFTTTIYYVNSRLNFIYTFSSHNRVKNYSNILTRQLKIINIISRIYYQFIAGSSKRKRRN